MWIWTKVIPRLSPTHSLRSMYTKSTKNYLPKDVNIVRLIGNVSTDVRGSSTKFFYMRTFDQNNFYDAHKIVVPAYSLEHLPGIPKVGQKVLVTGKLRTSHFTLKDTGKRESSLPIMAKQIYLCDDGETQETDSNANLESNTMNGMGSASDFELKDQNHVELMAQICFEIVNEDKFSSFNLSVHYLLKNSDGQEEEQTDFIQVFAYNETLRNILKTQLKRLDRVRVEGVLKHKSCVDNTGKRQYKGYIEAHKIAKLINLREVANEKKTAENVTMTVNN